MAVILFLLFFGDIKADEIGIKFTFYPKEVILGEPINVCLEASYKGNGSLTIGYGEKGFKIYALIERADGMGIKQKMRPPMINWVPYYNFEEIGKGWKKEICQDVSELKEIKEGEYYIYGVVESEGPYYKKGERIGELNEVKAWRGRVKTEKLILNVKEPQGQDREAYEYFKGEVPLSGERAKEVLEKFPTSTYAGWVLLENSEYNLKFKNKEYLNLKSSLEEAINKKSRKYIDLSNYAKERIKQIKDYLKNVPNFSLKDWLLFEVGYWYMYIGDWDKSANELKEIIKNKDALSYEKANELLELYRQRNLIRE